MYDVKDRILQLSALFPSAKAFLKKCEINNHSYITDIKKGRINNPGSDHLEKIVEKTGCSGTWLLTGKGEMFEKSGKSEVRENATPYEAVEGKLEEILDLTITNLEKEKLPELSLDTESRLAKLLSLSLAAKTKNQ
ncbi:MAG: hypothetical protein WEA58_04165 [Balneolaceae bacterium]